MEISPVSWAEWNARTSALPEPLSPTSKYLRAEAHPLKKDPDLAHWVLTFDQVKGGVPPEHVMRSSERVGGLATFLTQLEEHWGAPKEATAELKVRFALSAREWSSKVFAQPRQGAFSVGKARGTIDHQLVGWVIQQGDTRTQLGVYSEPDRDAHAVTVEWEGKLTVGRSLAAKLEEEAWTRVSTIFSTTRK